MKQKTTRKLLRVLLTLAMLLTLILAPGSFVQAEAETQPAYLTFTGTTAFSIKANAGKTWKRLVGLNTIVEGKLEYSTDASNWTVWDGSEINSDSVNNVLYLRGTGNNVITGENRDLSNINKYRWVITTSNPSGTVACSGDIRTLLEYSNPATSMREYCFSYLFYGCTCLTSAPALPATTLANSCYRDMFNGCTGLTSAPALPATTLATNCYGGMFSGCTGLKSAPVLPATTLAESCYTRMFSGCTGLTSAPQLPATELKERCYWQMFHGCTGLTSAPELPATELKQYCYEHMFSDCTGLTNAPTLPATTLAPFCYQNMFYGCKNLTTLPALPATKLVDHCYVNMFAECNKIKLSKEKKGLYTKPFRIPKDGVGTVILESERDDWGDDTMFVGTGGTFKGPLEINTTYYLAVDHTHDFTYAGSSDTITATCSANECPLTEQKITLTIAAPESLTYDGEAKTASLEGASVFFAHTYEELGLTAETATINYEGTGTTNYGSTTAAPVNVGSYKASITLDDVKTGVTASGEDVIEDVTATIEYTIVPKEVTLQWSDTQLEYNGSEQMPSATAGGLIDGDTCTVTVTGKQIDASDSAYTAEATELSNPNYKLPSRKTVSFTIAKADPVAPTDLKACVEQILSEIQLPDGWSWKNPSDNAGDVGTNRIKANYTPPAAFEKNYKAVEDFDVIVTVHEHNWGEWEKYSDATCTSRGKDRQVCSDCGKSAYRETTQIDPNNHTGETEIRNAKEATKTEDGYTGDVYCAGCHKKLKDGEVIKATGATDPKSSDNPYDNLTETEKKEADEVTTALRVNLKTGALVVKEAKRMGISIETVKLGTDTLSETDVDSSDPAGSDFHTLTARVTKRTTSALTLKWTAQKEADGYLIYSNRCGKTNKLQLVSTIEKKSTNKWTAKKLKRATYYKFIVVAYKNVDDAKMPIAASVVMHAPTKGGKLTVAKSLKLSKTKVSLKAGKSIKIKAKEVKEEAKFKIKAHRPVKFESSDPSVAEVDKKGKIKAKKAGKCKIFAYAQNGIFKTVNVTVK